MRDHHKDLRIHHYKLLNQSQKLQALRLKCWTNQKMFASVPSLIKTNTVCTPFTELESCKHSELPSWKLTSVSKNLTLLNKCSRDRNMISMSHRKSTGNERIKALKQDLFIDKSFAFHPVFATGGLDSTINHLVSLLSFLVCVCPCFCHSREQVWIFAWKLGS